MKKFIYILLISLLLGCGSEDKVEEESFDPELKDLAAKVDLFSSLASEGRILRQSSDYDREGIIFNMHKVRSILVALSRDPNDTNAVRALERAILDLRSYQVSERDIPRLSGMYTQMSNILYSYSKLQGLTDIQFLGNLLYQFDLADGTDTNTVYPFGNYNVGDGRMWSKRERLDRYLLGASGSEESWLISPRFDFRNVESPGFRIRHQFGIRRNQKRDTFNFSSIRNNVFQILVSEDYTVGDPSNFKWIRLKMDDVPSGRNFHSVDTGVVDLSRYKGKQITIALRYNGSAANGHFPSWDIERFEISGVTNKFNFAPFVKPKEEIPFLRIDFNELGDDALNGFSQDIQSTGSGNYYVNEHRGEKYVRVNGQNETGTKRLYTSVYNELVDLKEPAVSILHSTAHYKKKTVEKSYVRLFVAENKEGVELKDLQWIDLKLDNSLLLKPNYRKERTDWMRLPVSLIGKPIRLMFEWEGYGEKDTILWDLHQINFDEREGKE